MRYERGRGWDPNRSGKGIKVRVGIGERWLGCWIRISRVEVVAVIWMTHERLELIGIHLIVSANHDESCQLMRMSRVMRDAMGYLSLDDVDCDVDELMVDVCPV